MTAGINLQREDVPIAIDLAGVHEIGTRISSNCLQAENVGASATQRRPVIQR